MIHQDLEEVYQYLTNFLTEERLQKIEFGFYFAYNGRCLSIPKCRSHRPQC